MRKRKGSPELDPAAAFREVTAGCEDNCRDNDDDTEHVDKGGGAAKDIGIRPDGGQPLPPPVAEDPDPKVEEENGAVERRRAQGGCCLGDQLGQLQEQQQHQQQHQEVPMNLVTEGRRHGSGSESVTEDPPGGAEEDIAGPPRRILDPDTVPEDSSLAAVRLQPQLHQKRLMAAPDPPGDDDDAVLLMRLKSAPKHPAPPEHRQKQRRPSGEQELQGSSPSSSPPDPSEVGGRVRVVAVPSCPSAMLERQLTCPLRSSSSSEIGGSSSNLISLSSDFGTFPRVVVAAPQPSSVEACCWHLSSEDILTSSQGQSLTCGGAALAHNSSRPSSSTSSTLTSSISSSTPSAGGHHHHEFVGSGGAYFRASTQLQPPHHHPHPHHDHPDYDGFLHHQQQYEAVVKEASQSEDRDLGSPSSSSSIVVVSDHRHRINDIPGND